MKSSFLINALSFHGRASRKDFWKTFGMLFACVMGLSVMATIFDGVPVVEIIVGLIAFGFMLYAMVCALAGAARRLHDIGQSGHWLWFLFLLPAIPIGYLVCLVLLGTLRTQPRDNKYGPLNPSLRNPRQFARKSAHAAAAESSSLSEELSCLVGVLAHCATVNGLPTPRQTSLVESYLRDAIGLEGEQYASALRHFGHLLQDLPDYERQLKGVALYAKRCRERAILMSVLEVIFLLGLTDSSFSQASLSLLERAEFCFGEKCDRFAEYKTDQSEAAAARKRDEQTYANILNVDPAASYEVIHKAYRRLVKDFHPDTVASASAGIRALAEAEMKKINEAFAYFKAKLETA